MSQPDVLNPLQLEVMRLLDQIPQQIAQKGFFAIETYDVDAYGWCRLTHTAMEYIQRNPPQGMTVSKNIPFKVTKWKIAQT